MTAETEQLIRSARRVADVWASHVGYELPRRLREAMAELSVAALRYELASRLSLQAVATEEPSLQRAGRLISGCRGRRACSSTLRDGR